MAVFLWPEIMNPQDIEQNVRNGLSSMNTGMGNILTGIGKWGSENYIYDPKTNTPFPAGFIGKSIQASRQPMGSPEQINSYINMAQMAGLNSPTASLIHPIDTPQAISNVVQNSRPIHQVLLEKAASTGDFKGVGQILDSIPPTDPYKQPMEHIFRSTVPQGNINVGEQMFPSTTVPMHDDFDTAVDLIRGNVRGSLPDMNQAFETVKQEAQLQLTPAELEKHKGNIDKIIDLIQTRIRRQE